MGIKSPKKRRQAGFTLVELVLVAVIIGVLAAMAIKSLGGRAKEAKIKAAQGDIATIETTIDLFEVDNGFYPTQDQGLTALLEKPTGDPEPKNWKKYFRRRSHIIDPWGNEYVYVYPGEHNPDSFDLYSRGPDGMDGGDDDIINWDEEDIGY